jgi:tRNA pseudouridine55 synthase
MANGILIIDKPADWTSHDVVAKLRGILREKRIGHAGTLDPMATGVLPVFVGRATRAVEFFSEGGKEYVAGLRLGVITDTQDSTGTLLEHRPVSVTATEVKEALTAFTGDILQIPPMYSAIKKDGKKLYELARKGQEVERAPRPVTIYQLELLSQESPTDYILRVKCSKGTYIRTLCHDLGEALGCGGTMFSLRRTIAAGFPIADAVTMEQVQQQEIPSDLLLPVDTGFLQYPAVTVSQKAEAMARNGAAIRSPEAPDGLCRVYAQSGEFLLLGNCQSGSITTVKSFFEV